MNDEFLATYLNDHHAGSVGAIELLKHSIKANEGNEFAVVLQNFLNEISEEQTLLKKLIERIDSKKSSLKNVGGWIAEKLSRLKINNPLTPYSDENRFLEFEALFLGVNGKLDLWKVMTECFSEESRFSDFDFSTLLKQSEQQRDYLQKHCIKAAKIAFQTKLRGKNEN